MSVSAVCFEANCCCKVKSISAFVFPLRKTLSRCACRLWITCSAKRAESKLHTPRTNTSTTSKPLRTCNPARLSSHPALLEFGMHDDDSARMVKLAKRGWLGSLMKEDWEGCICLADLFRSIKRISMLVQWPIQRLHVVSRFTHDEKRCVGSKESLEKRFE